MGRDNTNQFLLSDSRRCRTSYRGNGATFMSNVGKMIDIKSYLHRVETEDTFHLPKIDSGRHVTSHVIKSSNKTSSINLPPIKGKKNL